MKEKISKTGRYAYRCDRCNKIISFESNTLKQVYIKRQEGNVKKLCDLCLSCYNALVRGIKKGKQQREENNS